MWNAEDDQGPRTNNVKKRLETTRRQQKLPDEGHRPRGLARFDKESPDLPWLVAARTKRWSKSKMMCFLQCSVANCFWLRLRYAFLVRVLLWKSYWYMLNHDTSVTVTGTHIPIYIRARVSVNCDELRILERNLCTYIRLTISDDLKKTSFRISMTLCQCVALMVPGELISSFGLITSGFRVTAPEVNFEKPEID